MRGLITRQAPWVPGDPPRSNLTHPSRWPIGQASSEKREKPRESAGFRPGLSREHDLGLIVRIT